MTPPALVDLAQPEIISRDAEDIAMRLVTAIQRLSLARTIEEIIKIVRTSARDISGAEGAAFILRDDQSCHYVDEDASSPLWKGQRFPMTHCISGWAMLNRSAVVIEDIYTDTRIPHSAYRNTFVKSLVIVPIRTEAPIGAIGIYWAESHLATASEVGRLQALANTTSVAIDNVRLYTELEQRVEERTRQLETANRELEAFSYTVSHDLQTPVRHITGYLEILTTDHNESLDENTKSYLTRIGTAAERMTELIHNLLRLARFSRMELKYQTVDFSALGEEVVECLRDEVPKRFVEVQVQEGMEIRADVGLLKIVLENLLGNAWKFTSKVQKPKIEFKVHVQTDDQTIFVIKDNGAGFDMRYVDKLFCPFARLHDGKAFSGTGVGLATVDKIIRRHGGRIWAEAARDQGAAFFFCLD